MGLGTDEGMTSLGAIIFELVAHVVCKEDGEGGVGVGVGQTEFRL